MLDFSDLAILAFTSSLLALLDSSYAMGMERCTPLPLIE